MRVFSRLFGIILSGLATNIRPHRSLGWRPPQEMDRGDGTEGPIERESNGSPAGYPSHAPGEVLPRTGTALKEQLHGFGRQEQEDQNPHTNQKLPPSARFLVGCNP